MWVTILTYATFVLDLTLKVLVRSEGRLMERRRPLDPHYSPPD